MKYVLMPVEPDLKLIEKVYRIFLQEVVDQPPATKLTEVNAYFRKAWAKVIASTAPALMTIEELNEYNAKFRREHEHCNVAYMLVEVAFEPDVVAE